MYIHDLRVLCQMIRADARVHARAPFLYIVPGNVTSSKGITHSLFVNVIRLVPSDEYETRYHALCWGFSFIIALIPLVASETPR